MRSPWPSRTRTSSTRWPSWALPRSPPTRSRRRPTPPSWRNRSSCGPRSSRTPASPASDPRPDLTEMTDTDAGARRAARADICAGGTFVALGGGFAIGALQYDLGTAFQMGPGYVPLTLGCVLAGLGALILGHGVLVALGHRV